MLTRIKSFVKDNQDDIILFTGVVLVALFSFALGFIIAKQSEKKPIEIEYLYEQEYSSAYCSFS